MSQTLWARIKARLFMSLIFLDCRILFAGDLGVNALEKYEKLQFLRAHNYIRAEHDLPSLKWNHYLYKQAQKWVNHLARTCQAYPSGTRFGENISLEWGVFPTSTHMIVKKWLYKERSEILWEQTIFLGCAKSSCIDNESLSHGNIVICLYFPREKIQNDKPIFIDRLKF